MNHNTKRLSPLFTLLVLFLSSVLFSSSIKAQDTLGLHLFSFSDSSEVTHASSDPLLLSIMIENEAATITLRENARNQRIREQYELTEDYKKLSEEELKSFYQQYPIHDIPQIKLGSNSVPLVELINFQIRNEIGENINLNVRPLANNSREKRTLKLEPHKLLYYQFVVASADLKKIADGLYHIVAALSTNNQQGMWQGLQYSNSLTVLLKQQHSDSNWAASSKRALMQSTYLVNDKQYEKAEKHALAWIGNHPESVSAWYHLGASLHGQGKKAKALTAYNTALSQFRLKYGSNPQELPEKILNRISELNNNPISIEQ